MRLIHTADWHLGRLFQGVSLLEDQAHILADLIRLIRDERPDALVIAGDIFDRQVAPKDAIRLLDETLKEVITGLKTPVLMIAGNHDSAQRIDFSSDLLADSGLHIRGTYQDPITPVRLNDRHGPVDFCLLPYEQAEPLVVRTRTGDTQYGNFDAAMSLACERALTACSADRKVAIAHCFAAGGNTSDSERPLSVGGSDQVSPKNFEGFNYVALGHLHRPQKVGNNGAYSGSLLKYSFSEASHTKSVSLVEIDDKGAFTRTEQHLSTKRDVRIVESEFDDLLQTDREPPSEDYVLARLTDRGALRDPLARLRDKFPNILGVERPALFSASGQNQSQSAETLKRTDEDLFASFFQDVTGEPLTNDERNALQQTLESLGKSNEDLADAT